MERFLFSANSIGQKPQSGKPIDGGGVVQPGAAGRAERARKSPGLS